MASAFTRFRITSWATTTRASVPRASLESTVTNACRRPASTAASVRSTLPPDSSVFVRMGTEAPAARCATTSVSSAASLCAAMLLANARRTRTIIASAIRSQASVENR